MEDAWRILMSTVRWIARPFRGRSALEEEQGFDRWQKRWQDVVGGVGNAVGVCVDWPSGDL